MSPRRENQSQCFISISLCPPKPILRHLQKCCPIKFYSRQSQLCLSLEGKRHFQTHVAAKKKTGKGSKDETKTKSKNKSSSKVREMVSKNLTEKQFMNLLSILYIQVKFQVEVKADCTPLMWGGEDGYWEKWKCPLISLRKIAYSDRKISKFSKSLIFWQIHDRESRTMYLKSFSLNGHDISTRGFFWKNYPSFIFSQKSNIQK